MKTQSEHTYVLARQFYIMQFYDYKKMWRLEETE